MGILNSFRTYQGKWAVASKQPFPADEIDAIESNVITDSEEYPGRLSLKCSLKGGGVKFLPLSNTCKNAIVGESVDLAKCFIVTLHRDGDEDKFRLEF